MSNRIVAVIPARMGSSRFPGKPMAPILGMPMIEHVFRRTRLCADLHATCVATCDREIFDHINTLSPGSAVMTADTHQRCTDRIAEAIENIDADIIVNVQGDEPLVRPEMISAAVAPLLADPSIPCANLMAPLETDEEAEDLNEVKVVPTIDGFAMYFSRAPLPSFDVGKVRCRRWKQVCIIPFRRDALALFNRLPPTDTERAESVDMNRFLEHGYRVKLVPVTHPTYSVDTLDDLRHVETVMRQDDLLELYAAAR